VLSAMSGTTNTLLEIVTYLYQKQYTIALDATATLEKNYFKVIAVLFTSHPFKKKGNDLIQSHFSYIQSFTQDMFTQFEEKAILARCECSVL
jgi:aspartate kinase